MKTDYPELDNAILKRLASAPRRFLNLTDDLRQIADPLAKLDPLGKTTRWRVMDHRLQALRKAGKLKHDRKFGWSLA